MQMEWENKSVAFVYTVGLLYRIFPLLSLAKGTIGAHRVFLTAPIRLGSVQATRIAKTFLSATRPSIKIPDRTLTSGAIRKQKQRESKKKTQSPYRNVSFL